MSTKYNSEVSIREEDQLHVPNRVCFVFLIRCGAVVWSDTSTSDEDT